MIKVDSELMKEFYYGNEFLKKISDLIGYDDIEFVNLGYDENKISIDGEAENDSGLIEFTIEGYIKPNMIVFENDINNYVITYSLTDGEYRN